MEIFARLRARRKKAKERDVTSQARRRIEVSDFDDKLFIAYDGTPVFPIEEQWTTKEIMQRLYELRANYIKAKMSETRPSVAVF